jgi:hypothetical protein
MNEPVDWPQAFANLHVQAWVCLNDDHRYVTWTDDVARCDTCGLTSEQTRDFARRIERAVRDRIAAEQVAYAQKLNKVRDLSRQPQSFINGILAAATIARGDQ